MRPIHSLQNRYPFHWRDDLIEPHNGLMQLGTNAANKQIAKGTHFSEDDRRTVFNQSIRLRYWRQNDITFLHSPGLPL